MPKKNPVPGPADLAATASTLHAGELCQLREAIDRLDNERHALVLDPKGKVYKLKRLGDEEFLHFRRRGLAIREADWFPLMIYLTLHREKERLGLAEAYLALTQLAGPSGRCFDDSKSSFSFPFLLEGPRIPANRPYLLEVRDYRGSLEFPVRKVVDADDPRLLDGLIHAPFADEFSDEENEELVTFLSGYLMGFWNAIRHRVHDPFLKRVDSNLILYGCCDGACFAEQHDSWDHYEAALGRYANRVRRDKKDAGKEDVCRGGEH